MRESQCRLSATTGGSKGRHHTKDSSRRQYRGHRGLRDQRNVVILIDSTVVLSCSLFFVLVLVRPRNKKEETIARPFRGPRLTRLEETQHHPVAAKALLLPFRLTHCQASLANDTTASVSGQVHDESKQSDSCLPLT